MTGSGFPYASAIAHHALDSSGWTQHHYRAVMMVTCVGFYSQSGRISVRADAQFNPLSAQLMFALNSICLDFAIKRLEPIELRTCGRLVGLASGQRIESLSGHSLVAACMLGQWSMHVVLLIMCDMVRRSICGASHVYSFVLLVECSYHVFSKR